MSTWAVFAAGIVFGWAWLAAGALLAIPLAGRLFGRRQP